MQYTIDSINNDGSINVTFDIDGVSQNLSGAPLDSLDALNQFLFDYGTSYEAGVNSIQPPVISPDVTALVGQSYDVSVADNKLISTIAKPLQGKVG